MNSKIEGIMENKKGLIFVTGGAGFIGSMVNLMLHDAGYDTIVYDNFSTGDPKAVLFGELIEGDLNDKEKIERILKSRPFKAVIHLAALTDVGESVSHPDLYYANNVVNTLHLLNGMRQAKIPHLIFSSSAAVYGIPTTNQVTEHSPCVPINPYGESKLMMEKVLRDYSNAFGIRSISLRYFNAAGGDPSFRLKHFKKKENNLIPIVLDSIKRKTEVTIFGTDYDTPDGTCIRDYIHVADLGRAHILAMEKLFDGKETTCYNLGNAQGFSVREVIQTAEQVTAQKVLVKEGARRAGDPPVLLADATKAHKELNWIPRYPELKIMVEHAWKARNS